MSGLQFRNVDASPSDPVESWPYEALVTAIERGMLSDWRRIAAAMDRRPWGTVARDVEAYAKYGAEAQATALLIESLDRSRARARASERRVVAAQVAEAVSRSGMPAGRFAIACGTSPARLSTYLSGKVTPSAAMMVRFRRVADDAAGLARPPT